ncbi:ABC transporter permease subunit [Oceanobacillus sp. CAU 1775]
MKVAMIKHEFKMIMRNRKNILFLITILGLILTYAFLIHPTMITPDSFNAEQMENDITNNKAIQQGMIARGGTGFGGMTGNAYATNVYETRVQSAMVNAFHDENYDRFVQLRMKGFAYEATNRTRDWWLIADAPYPGLDAARDGSLHSLRYQALLDVDAPITYEMIEQKTALQTIVNFLMGTLAAFVIVCAIYFSSDMLSRDRQHPSLLQGMPIGWYSLINVKSLVTFMYSLLVIIGLFLLAYIVIGIQSGFGSLAHSIPITIPSTEPDAYFGYRFSEYDTISTAKFLGLALGIIPIIVYLFIRVNAIFSLLFKNSWIVLMVSTVLLFSERIYYSRTLTELFGIDISNLPQTYFDFGRVISGEKYYLVSLEAITYEKAIIVLLVTILIVEVLLFLMSRIITKRRFYRRAV